MKCKIEICCQETFSRALLAICLLDLQLLTIYQFIQNNHLALNGQRFQPYLAG